MMSLFGRWLFPKDHFELYFEWAKSELPRSLRDFVIAPQDAQGYTMGLQWALPARNNSTVRFQKPKYRTSNRTPSSPLIRFAISTPAVPPRRDSRSAASCSAPHSARAVKANGSRPTT